jgi:hypothetical protein
MTRTFSIWGFAMRSPPKPLVSDHASVTKNFLQNIWNPDTYEQPGIYLFSPERHRRHLPFRFYITTVPTFSHSARSCSDISTRLKC